MVSGVGSEFELRGLSGTPLWGQSHELSEALPCLSHSPGAILVLLLWQLLSLADLCSSVTSYWEWRTLTGLNSSPDNVCRFSLGDMYSMVSHLHVTRKESRRAGSDKK